MIQSSLVVWRFMDGKKGHEKQTEGLLQGLKNELPISIKQIDLQTSDPFVSYFQYESPDLLLGAGHATHLPMLLARLCFGGQTVLMMKPSLPAIFFDLVFVPRHDTCASFGQIEFTEGVLGPKLEGIVDPNVGVILLGGASRHFAWENAFIHSAIDQITAGKPEKKFVICDSPRTPSNTLDTLNVREPAEKRPWQETHESYVTELLSSASEIWVTCDSVTMLYEALATDVPVGIIELAPKKRSSRINKLQRGINHLARENRVHLSGNGFRLDDESRITPSLSENHRCARIVARSLLDLNV